MNKRLFTLLLCGTLMITAMGATRSVHNGADFARESAEYVGVDFDANYLEEMIECAVSGDDERGRDAAYKRAVKKAVVGDDTPDVRYDDLLLLAKVIYHEAGSSWLSMEWKMKVGEVLVNRVASPEFPNTLEGCVYAPGQYAGVRSERFAKLRPDAVAATAAARLLCGERLLNDPSVVFQAGFPQGSGIAEKLYDSYYGYTYLCYSSYPEKYE